MPDVAKAILGPPKTAKYRPPAFVGGQGWMGGVGVFHNRTIEEMRQDPQVKLCLDYRKATIHTAEFEFAGNSEAVKKFGAECVGRFWRKGLPIALECLTYGYTGAEVQYKEEGGRVKFDYLKTIYPTDVRPWTVKGKLAYLRVASLLDATASKDKNKRQDGAVWLEAAEGVRPAKGIWFVHEGAYHPWFGLTVLNPSWLPWRWKNMPDGAIDIIAKWYYRHAYSGMIVRHPDVTFQDAPGGPEISAQDTARQMGQIAKTGANFALSSERDDKGNYLWDIVQYAKAEGSGVGKDLLDYINAFLDIQIQRGIGIPDELITHQGSTGGYSRSQVSLTAYLIGAELVLHEVLEAFVDQVLNPLIRLNFGKGARFSVKPKPLLPQGDQPPPGGAPPGAAPPPPPGAAAPPSGGNPLADLFGGDKGKDKPLQFSWSPFPTHNGTTGAVNEKGERLYGEDAKRVLASKPLQAAQETVPAITSAAAPMPTVSHTPDVPLAGPMRWGEVVSHDAPHTMIIGPSGSGKSIMAQAIAANLGGKLLIIDPVWRPGNWGGLPVVTVDEDGQYTEIEKALEWVLGEMKARGAQLQRGIRSFEPITVLWDEVPDTVAEIPTAGVVVRRLGQRGRHANIRLIGIGQSDRVGAWGIEGYGDVPENFAHVFLGDKAVDKIPELAGQQRPGVLEWQGKKHAIDLSAIMEMSRRPIPVERAVAPPGVAMAATPTEAPSQLSWQQVYDYAAQLAWSPFRTAKGTVGAQNYDGQKLYGEDARRVLEHQATMNRREQLQREHESLQVPKSIRDGLGPIADELQADREERLKTETWGGGEETGEQKAATWAGGKKPEEETGPQALEETGDHEAIDDSFELDDDAAKESDDFDAELSPETRAEFERDFAAIMKGERPSKQEYFAPRGGLDLKSQGRKFKAGEAIPPDVLAKIPLKKRNLLETKSDPVTFNDVARKVGGSAVKAGQHALHTVNRIAKKGLRVIKGDETLRHAAKRATQKAIIKYKRVEQRYGKAAAMAMAGAYLGSYVLWGTNPAVAAIVAPEPMAQLIGIAEGIKQLKQRISPTPVQMSAEQAALDTLAMAASAVTDAAGRLASAAERPVESPTIHFAPTLNMPAVELTMPVTMPAAVQAPPVIQLGETVINMPEQPPANVTVEATVVTPPRRTVKEVKRDRQGEITGSVETEEDA